MLDRLRHAYRMWTWPRMRRKVGLQRRMVARFVASHQPQSDVDFFAACMSGAPPEWLRWSSAVRWAIARLGRVHPRFIRSDDRFSDLMSLPGFRDEELERLPRVDSYDDLPVREFVRQAVELCARKVATARLS